MDAFEVIRLMLAAVLAGALALLLLRYARRRANAQAELAQRLFDDVLPLLENVKSAPGESAGSWVVTGRYQGELFQLQTITDTLSVRKLPSLWLMVTLPKPQPLTARFDFMMRPAGQTTFSRFDFLPHTLPLPEGFPEDGVLRSDEMTAPPSEALSGALGLFRARRGKELLLSPKGLRIVWHLAEGDRARYGVYREARFSDARIDASLAAEIMNTLLQLDKDLAARHG